MRASAGALLLGLGACADPPSDPARYALALDPATAFEDALVSCAGIATSTGRGDCQVAVMEAHGRLEAADCARVEEGTWRDECTFLLAERMWAAGEFDAALETCLTTRFARRCSWHLVQDEVEASLHDPPAVAEARLDRFRDARRIPDAAEQFWKIRFRERGAAGLVADEADCDVLAESISCRKALTEHVHAMLDAASRSDRARVCAAEPGERVSQGGKPLWLVSPLTQAAEAQWVARRCADQGPAREAGAAPQRPPPSNR